jgi:opacity protein-like surface antigen
MTKLTIRFAAILLFISCSWSGYSQESHIRLGLSITPAISWMNPNEKNYSYNGVQVGASLGFVSEFHFTEHYAITTGFNFSFLGGDLKYPYAQAKDTGTLSRKYSFRYLEIPLMIKMKTKMYGNFSFFGQIGIGTDFLLRIKAADSFLTRNNVTISDNSNLTTKEVSFIREAILVGLGAEYKIDESLSLVMGLNYSNSLNTVLQGNNTTDSNLQNKSSLNFAGLNIGIFF